MIFSMLRNKKWFQLCATLSIVILGLIGSVSSVRADSAPDIAISPVYTKNQISKNGIFYVLSRPRKSEKFSIRLFNSSNENQKVTVVPTTGYTNDSGIMSFDRIKVPEDPSRRVSFRDITTPKKKSAMIPGKESIVLTFKTSLPSEKFSGVLLGGLHVTVQQHTFIQNNKGAAIRNQYSYGMAVTIKEFTKHVEPRLTIGKVGPKIGNNKQVVINSKLYNDRPAVISDMSIKSKITKKEGNEISGVTNESGLSMAPNSNFSFANNWGKRNLFPGKYHIHMNVTANNGKSHWILDKDFNISIRDAIVNYNNNNPWLKYVLLCLLLLIIIALLIYLIYRQKKNQKRRNNYQDS